MVYLRPSVCHRGKTCTKAVRCYRSRGGRQKYHRPRLPPRVSQTYLGLELAYLVPSLCHRNTCTKAVRPHCAPGGRHKDCRSRRRLPRVSPTCLRSAEHAYLRPSLCHQGNTCTKAVRRGPGAGPAYSTPGARQKYHHRPRLLPRVGPTNLGLCRELAYLGPSLCHRKPSTKGICCHHR